MKEKGFSFNMDTAAYNDEGKLKNIYLDGEFGGFAKTGDYQTWYI